MGTTVKDMPAKGTSRYYWAWVYYITRVWQVPKEIVDEGRGSAAKIVGFAVILSTFGYHGQNIRPCADTLAKRANLSHRTAGHLRQRCIELGLFKVTGQTALSIPVLEINIPEGVSAVLDDPWDIPPAMVDGKPKVKGNIGSNDVPTDQPEPKDDAVIDPWSEDFDPGPVEPVGELRPPELEPTLRERLGAAAEDEQPKYRANPETGKRERTGEIPAKPIRRSRDDR